MTIRSSRRRHGPDDRSRSRVSEDEGGSLIEFAVTLPVLFTLIFCFMEMCMALYTYETISDSARQGTRYAMVRGASCPSTANPTCEATVAQVKAYVSGLAWPNVGGGAVTPSVVYDGNEAVGTHVQVTVSYTFQITMPFVPKKSITMSSTSETTIIQ
jgi:Flp pilus assembly protein TadG